MASNFLKEDTCPFKLKLSVIYPIDWKQRVKMNSTTRTQKLPEELEHSKDTISLALIRFRKHTRTLLKN